MEHVTTLSSMEHVTTLSSMEHVTTLSSMEHVASEGRSQMWSEGEEPDNVIHDGRLFQVMVMHSEQASLSSLLTHMQVWSPPLYDTPYCYSFSLHHSSVTVLFHHVTSVFVVPSLTLSFFPHSLPPFPPFPHSSFPSLPPSFPPLSTCTPAVLWSWYAWSVTAFTGRRSLSRHMKTSNIR